MRAAVAILALCAAALTHAARADDDPACAKFEDPLAYNACLASHGPKAKEPVSAPAAAGVRRIESQGDGGPAAAPTRVPHTPGVVRRGGRIHMEFRIR